MKKKKYRTTLLSALAVSMLFTNLAAAVSATGVYREYDVDGWSQPAITVLMQGIAHQGAPRTAQTIPAVSGNTPSGQQPGSTAPDVPSGLQPDSTAPDAPSGQQPDSTAPDVPSGQQPDSTAPDVPSGLQPDSTAPDVPEVSLPYSFQEVTQEYFDDALLIGDSRAAGIQLYSGWDNITYYTENGMTIYSMFDCEAEEKDGRMLTVEEALQERSFGKIYLEIGINEMGTGTVDSFMEAYEDAVNHLRELQPDAVIYVCGIMCVKQSRSESDPIFNNPNIRERNDRIARLADGEHIFYLDINETVADETGNLNPDYTWDQVHLLGKYNILWLEYFCSHGIVKDG